MTSPKETQSTEQVGTPGAPDPVAPGSLAGLPDAEHEARRLRARRGAWVSLATFFLTLIGLDQGFRRSQMARRLAAESLYMGKPNAFTESREGADVAIVGDSRVLHGFNPHVVEAAVQTERAERIRAYNGGLSGAPPMAQLAWIRRFLTHAHPPRVVLISISPYMFSSRIQRATSREALTTMYRLIDVPAVVRAGAAAEDIVTVFNSGVFESVRLRPRVLEMVLKFTGFNEPTPLGDQGFLMNGEVDPYTQDVRGRGRGIGYRYEMWRPEAHFGNEQMGFFIESLRELRAAGVQTIVLNSQSATQVDLAYGPNSIYDQHIAWVRAQAQRFGATFADVRHNPAVSDPDYNDGDHLGGNGAARYSAYLAHEYIVPALGGARMRRPAGCRTVLDFEDASLPGWTRSGEAFADPIAVQGRRMQQPVYGYTGQGFLTTFTTANTDRATGEASSPRFALSGNEVRVRVGGGGDAALTVALEVDGREVAHAQGRNDETLRDVVWDVREFAGREATLRVRDNATGGWGHIQVDDVAVCP